MSLPRLPLTVIGGYLGAGKTTLINRLLREDHGQRVLVMVNDFGAINIDADLLVSADGDTMTLTNGCVCCTMGADLFMAMGDALDRRPRPDHLVIEASGIADPARIATAARAEPDMAYGGIAVVVDAMHWGALA
ncbi:MAG: GTP-binding protein, partial [Paracoccaceae bacterium]|nr:GTP-binding protein [Paracoccaceae bacterium]